MAHESKLDILGAVQETIRDELRCLSETLQQALRDELASGSLASHTGAHLPRRTISKDAAPRRSPSKNSKNAATVNVCTDVHRPASSSSAPLSKHQQAQQACNSAATVDVVSVGDSPEGPMKVTMLNERRLSASRAGDKNISAVEFSSDDDDESLDLDPTTSHSYSNKCETSRLQAAEDEQLLSAQHVAMGFLSGSVMRRKSIESLGKLGTEARVGRRKSIESLGKLGTEARVGATTPTCESQPSGAKLDPVVPFGRSASDKSGDMASPWQAAASVFSVSWKRVRSGDALKASMMTNGQPRSKLYYCMRYMVISQAFDYAIGAVVFANAICIGSQVDWSARNPKEETPLAYKVLSWLFCAFFTAELAVRMYVFGKKFYFSKDWKWNMFDTVIVICQQAEELAALVVGDTRAEQKNFLLVRILRVLRVVRLVRFVRILHLIRELHTMVGSIVGSLRSFLWTVALLFGLIYVVGVYLTQLVGEHLSSTNEEASGEADVVKKYYGSIGSSVLTLFQALSGGIDWEDPLRALYIVTTWRVAIAVFFSCYIAFAMFVMMNLVTGIFVDSAQNNIREDRELDLVNRVHQLFVTTDDNQSGHVTWQEFERQLDTPEMEEYFKAIDLDPSEARHLFDLLDVNSRGSLTSEEFVNGCLRMRGAVTAYDAASQIRWTRDVTARMLRCMRNQENVTKQIAEAMNLDVEASRLQWASLGSIGEV